MYTTYVNWGGGRVKLTWQPGAPLPPTERVTSVHGFCFWQGQLMLVDLKQRGGDIPGGHLEPGETPEECFRREALEEGCVRGGPCTLLGCVEVDHRENPAWRPDGPYPQVGYQVLYRMEIAELLPFSDRYESSRRFFVSPAEAPGHHHQWHPILDHMLATAQLLAPGREWRIRYLKYPDRPHLDYQARFVGEQDGWLITHTPPGTPFTHHTRGLTFAADWHSISYWPRGGWYCVSFGIFPDGRLRHMYCNVNTPAVMTAGGLESVDLDLDVTAGPDLRWQLEDEDEFDRHRQAYQYPPELVEGARRAVDEMVARLERRAFPFCLTAAEHLAIIRRCPAP